jgi:hypothetical protein
MVIYIILDSFERLKGWLRDVTPLVGVSLRTPDEMGVEAIPLGFLGIASSLRSSQ